MGMFDAFLGSSGAPAPTESPDLKQFLGPIMEAMAVEAKRASDPISRIGDVGSAVLGTVGSGVPYAQGLAALDKQRRDTVQGGAQLFLSMLGQERQLKALENEAAYRTATLQQGEKRLALEEKKIDADSWQPMQITTPSGATKVGRFNRKTGVFEEAGAPSAAPSAAAAPPATPPRDMAGVPPGIDQLNESGQAELEARLRRDPAFLSAKTLKDATVLESVVKKHTADLLKIDAFRVGPRVQPGGVEQRTDTVEFTRPRAGDPVPQHLTGKALIEWLKQSPDFGPEYARTVQMVGDYDTKIPATYGRKPEVATYMKALASQYNPNWQEDAYDRRRQAQKAFEPGGQTYNNITNIRQIFPHLETLTKAVDALNNGDFRALNSVTAAVRKQAGVEAITNMEQAARVVGLEAMRVFRQVGASEAEAQDFAKTLSTAASPAQLAGVIGQLHEQLSARLKSHSEAYKEATRSPSRPEGRPFEMLPGELGQAEKRVTDWVKKRTGIELTPEQMSDPAQRVKGTVYKTPKGPLMWDGDGWVKPR